MCNQNTVCSAHSSFLIYVSAHCNDSFKWVRFCVGAISLVDFPSSSVGKESACNAGDGGLISGWGRAPKEGSGNPLQCSSPGGLQFMGFQKSQTRTTKSNKEWYKWILLLVPSFRVEVFSLCYYM